MIENANVLSYHFRIFRSTMCKSIPITYAKGKGSIRSISDVRPGCYHACKLFQPRRSVNRFQLLKMIFVEYTCLAQNSLVVPFWRPLDGSSKPSFGPGDKSLLMTDQHTALGSLSQLSQLTKLSPWLTLFKKTSLHHSDTTMNDFVFCVMK